MIVMVDKNEAHPPSAPGLPACVPEIPHIECARSIPTRRGTSKPPSDSEDWIHPEDKRSVTDVTNERLGLGIPTIFFDTQR